MLAQAERSRKSERIEAIDRIGSIDSIDFVDSIDYSTTIMAHTLVILAAGMGSRYGGLKQTDPVGPCGEFIIDYSAYDAIRAGFDRIVFVIRRDMADDFRNTIGARVGEHATVEYAYQELDCLPQGFSVPADRKKPWGTGHALLVCRELVSGPFAVINADDFYGRTSFETLARFLTATTDDETLSCLVGFPLRITLSPHGAVSRAICTVEEGCLKDIVEHTRIEADGVADSGRLSGDKLVSTNIWGLKASFFEHLDNQFRGFLEEWPGSSDAEFFLPSVIDTLIKSGDMTVNVLESPGPWFGITHPEDRPDLVAALRALINTGDYRSNLWARA
ncbi:NDP-sugar synthase [Verrucomicrobiota bacterium]